MKDNYPVMPKTTTKTEYRRNPKARARHFLSLWIEDETIKSRLTAIAKAEGRSVSSYFNFHIAPRLRRDIEAKWAELPEAVLNDYEEKMKATKIS